MIRPLWAARVRRKDAEVRKVLACVTNKGALAAPHGTNNYYELPARHDESLLYHGLFVG